MRAAPRQRAAQRAAPAPAGGVLTLACASAAAALDGLEKDRSVRGVVIASGLKKDIFTAGCVRHAAPGTRCGTDRAVLRLRSNDIAELYSKATTVERYTRFWHAQTRCLVRRA